VAYLARNLKLSIIQDSDSDHNKGEFKNNEFFVHLKYVNTNIAKYQREDQSTFFLVNGRKNSKTLWIRNSKDINPILLF